MDIWTILWVGWLAIFVVLEGIAIVRSDRGDTLSEKVWSWFSLKGPKGELSAWRAVTRFLFLAFWAWLTIHFLSGGAWL